MGPGSVGVAHGYDGCGLRPRRRGGLRAQSALAARSSDETSTPRKPVRHRRSLWILGFSCGKEMLKLEATPSAARERTEHKDEGRCYEPLWRRENARFGIAGCSALCPRSHGTSWPNNHARIVRLRRGGPFSLARAASCPADRLNGAVHRSRGPRPRTTSVKVSRPERADHSGPRILEPSVGRPFRA